MNSLVARQRCDDMFPEMFHRFMRPLSTDFEAPGEIKVDLTGNEKDYQARADADRALYALSRGAAGAA